MKVWILVSAGLRRRLSRTVLTLLATMVAFFLLGVMSGVVSALSNLIESVDDQRLRVVSRAGFGQDLPMAWVEQIRQLEGVAVAAAVLGFPVTYQGPENAFGGAAVQPQQYLAAFNEFTFTDAQAESKFLNTKNGAIAGGRLAARYGWQVGDILPLTSTYLVNSDANKTWPVRLVAIHNSDPDDNSIIANEFYVNLAFVDEYRAEGAGMVHMFVVAVTDDATPESVAASIDAAFINSTYATRTFNEQAFFANRMAQIGDIPRVIQRILLAVFFALLFVVGSAMLQSVTSRRVEFAIMNAVGFSYPYIAYTVLLEAGTLVFCGATLGLGLAAMVFPILFATVAMPGVQLAVDVYILGGLAAMGLMLIVALWPVVSLMRAVPAQALVKG